MRWQMLQIGEVMKGSSLYVQRGLMAMLGRMGRGAADRNPDVDGAVQMLDTYMHVDFDRLLISDEIVLELFCLRIATMT